MTAGEDGYLVSLVSDGRTGHHPALRVLTVPATEPVVTRAIADSPIMKSMASAIAPVPMHRALCLTALLIAPAAQRPSFRTTWVPENLVESALILQQLNSAHFRMRRSPGQHRASRVGRLHYGRPLP